MPFWIIFITNPFFVFLYAILFEIGFRVLSQIGCIHDGTSFKRRLQIYGVIVLVSFILNFKALFTDDHKKSKVNITPIASLDDEQINSLEEVLIKLEDNDFITINNR